MTSDYWKEKIAVITGASGGIGARLAVKLANAGIIVVGLARRTELIDQLNDQVKGTGKIFNHYLDVTEESSILNTFQWIHQKFNCIHILICNAGILKANFLSESPYDELRELYDVNILGTTLCLREGLKIMRTVPEIQGHIIVINSVLGHRIPVVPMPLFSVYPASKHAITALCQTVRQEIQFFKLNIKLTSINPDMVDTDLLKVYSKAVDVIPKLNAEDVALVTFNVLETPPHVQIEDVTLQAIPRHENA